MADRTDEPQRLDVLIVSQPVEYGVAVCVRQQAEAAVAAGHRVTVACPSSDEGPLAGWIKDVGATHKVLNLKRQPTLNDLAGVRSLRRLARHVDVLHLHSSKAGAVGRVAAATLSKRNRPAVIFTPHYWSWQVDSRLSGLYRWIERLLAHRCDAIVAVSEQEANEGRAVLGSVSSRLTVIPNGVDRTRFSPDGDRSIRDTESPLVVCVGRLSKQKGQDLAIRALAQLRSTTARLRLVGDENPVGEKKHLETLAISLGVEDRIEWWGKVTDTAPEFRAADVAIAPSRWEGMSLVFLEAMACGTALVVADVFGSEAVGSAAVIVPPEDANALAQAIDTLLENAPHRQRLGEAAREQSGLYDLVVTLTRNLQMWSDLVHDRQAGQQMG